MSSYRDLGFDSYEAYLRSRHWAELRRRFFQSNQPQDCQGMRAERRCNASVVQLHHWTYKRLGREKLNDLVPLCADCHERVHELAGDTFNSHRLRHATHVVCGIGLWSTKKQRKKVKQQWGPTESRKVRPLAGQVVLNSGQRAALYARARTDDPGERAGHQSKALDTWSKKTEKARRKREAKRAKKERSLAA